MKSSGRLASMFCCPHMCAKASRRRLRFLMCAGVVAVMAGAEAQAQTILLDNYESGSIRVVNPNETIPQGRYLWNQYEDDPTEGPDPGVESISSTAQAGSGGLRVNVTRGNLYLQFYPYDGVWRKMSEFTQPSSNWRRDTFNRMRFWIKVPRSVNDAPPGQANAYMGTYVRSSNGSPYSAEDGGGHGYHSFNIPYTGEWHQIIIDTHPNHWRGASGGVEPGNQEYPTGEAGYNYFDALTRFYVDFVGGLSSVPADFYLDGFELYRETRPENIGQIYTLHGVHIPSTNTIQVGWMRHKDQNSVRHEVRYAFNDVFQIGWQNATPAPFGMITPPGWQGYNGMEWSTNSIDLTSRSVIYIAIKPENSTSFRQIAIPLNGAGPAPGDTTPPTISVLSPGSGATGVSATANVTARFSEALDAASVTSATFDLRGPQDLVSASISYDAATMTAILNPSSSLAGSTTYTATVHGGSSGMKDAAGNPLASDRSWSFTTAAAADTTPPTITTLTPAAGATNVARTSNVSAGFSEALDPASVTSATFDLRGPSGVVAAGIAYDSATRTAVLNPSSSLAVNTTYTATVYGGSSGVKDSAGNALASSRSWSFTTAADTTAPTISARSPGAGATGVPIGANVTAQFDEAMTAASINGSTVELRSAAGLVSAAVSYNSTSFIVTVNPGANLAFSTTYTATVKGGSTGVQDASGNPMAAASSWSFTTQADTTAPTVVSMAPAAGATGVALSSSVTVGFSEAMNPASVSSATFELRGPAGAVSAAVSYNSSTGIATLDPSLPLLGSTTYTAVVRGGTAGVKDSAGYPLAADFTWSFTTGIVPYNLFGNATPAGVDPDTVPIEIGIKFHAHVNGHIVGIRFYKYGTNTGTHRGNLWMTDGTRLATVTFSNETSSGWQEARFSSPIPVDVNRTYVASYHAPAGQYGVTEYYFSGTGKTNEPLHAKADGVEGPTTVYVYSSTSQFPTQTYRASNYYVDVLFVPSN